MLKTVLGLAELRHFLLFYLHSVTAENQASPLIPAAIRLQEAMQSFARKHLVGSLGYNPIAIHEFAAF
ncbi:unnamed protein product [Heligmosomoides polygyrus]|uniref:NR LBD domain-containing protein n=1 Tax=Heligmosomoides polygyrus TaxID=6339 RepID=A0A183GIN3_HELPZ|nr:unnamed protein product [Heligmosomoides polygyrus]